MKITHDYNKGITKITLNWTETRQFISDSSAMQAVQLETRKLVNARRSTLEVPGERKGVSQS